MMHRDAELLDRWQAGDAAAGEELFCRYVDLLRRFFCTKIAGNSEDLVQETILACLENQAMFERRASFRAFLLGIARFQLYAHYRHNKRDQGRLDFEEVAIADMSPLPSALAANSREQRVLLEALRSLPLNLQLLLELWYWEEMSAPELTVVFDIPTDTVYSRLRRARELLAARLKRIGDQPNQLHATETNLETWARAVRENIGALTDQTGRRRRAAGSVGPAELPACKAPKTS